MIQTVLVKIIVAATVRVVKSRSNSGSKYNWGEGNGTDSSVNGGGKDSADNGSGMAVVLVKLAVIVMW